MEQKPTKVVGRRVAAWFIDFAIFLAITIGSWFALTSQVSGQCPPDGGGVDIGDSCRGFAIGDGGQQAVWIVIGIATPLILWVILPGLRGTSPGHAAVGARIVNAEGEPPGLWRGLVRGFFLWLIDVSLVGLIVALATERNQRVGDLVASTYVIRKDAVGAQASQDGQHAGVGAGASPGWSAPPAGGAPPQPAPPAQAADWYPDPHGAARLRYWDGQRWTDHTSN